MCGRYMSTTPPAALAEEFGVAPEQIALDDDLEPRWNVAPTLPVLAVAESRSAGARRLGTFRWGLVPSWSTDASGAARMINARAETVATKPAYRDAFARRRCIIPADGFYEWSNKQPYAIARKDGHPLAFAGVWEVWQEMRTCSIITTTANAALEHLHHRMPVVLDRADWDTWLDRDFGDTDALRQMLVPAPSEDFTCWPVSTRVNKADNEGPDLARPLPEWLAAGGPWPSAHVPPGSPEGAPPGGRPAGGSTAPAGVLLFGPEPAAS